MRSCVRPCSTGKETHEVIGQGPRPSKGDGERGSKSSPPSSIPHPALLSPHY